MQNAFLAPLPKTDKEFYDIIGQIIDSISALPARANADDLRHVARVVSRVDYVGRKMGIQMPEVPSGNVSAAKALDYLRRIGQSEK